MNKEQGISNNEMKDIDYVMAFVTSKFSIQYSIFNICL